MKNYKDFVDNVKKIYEQDKELKKLLVYFKQSLISKKKKELIYYSREKLYH